MTPERWIVRGEAPERCTLGVHPRRGHGTGDARVCHGASRVVWRVDVVHGAAHHGVETAGSSLLRVWAPSLLYAESRLLHHGGVAAVAPVGAHAHHPSPIGDTLAQAQVLDSTFDKLCYCPDTVELSDILFMPFKAFIIYFLWLRLGVLLFHSINIRNHCDWSIGEEKSYIRGFDWSREYDDRVNAAAAI